MKNSAAKFALCAGLTAAVAVSATALALAKAPVLVANGTYGVEGGSIRSVILICLDSKKNIANGVTIHTGNQPVGWAGHKGMGIVATCP